MPTDTNPAALTTTRQATGAYTVSAGGHSFFVAKESAGSWYIEGLDTRSDTMVRDGVYHGTAYAAAQLLADATGGYAPTLRDAKARIAAIFETAKSKECEHQWAKTRGNGRMCLKCQVVQSYGVDYGPAPAALANISFDGKTSTMPAAEVGAWIRGAFEPWREAGDRIRSWTIDGVTHYAIACQGELCDWPLAIGKAA